MPSPCESDAGQADCGFPAANTSRNCHYRQRNTNDVTDHHGFAASFRPGGRLVLALNNPYSAVIDHHATDYFDSGAASPYRGLWEAGIKTYCHHWTLEN